MPKSNQPKEYECGCMSDDSWTCEYHKSQIIKEMKTYNETYTTNPSNSFTSTISREPFSLKRIGLLEFLERFPGFMIQLKTDDKIAEMGKKIAELNNKLKEKGIKK